MTTENIKNIIFTILEEIAPEADFEELDPQENILEALDIDSFDHLNLMIALNEKLGVEIPEADYGDLDTLDHIVGYLTARVAG
jgi:acyl carrier protein